MVLQHKFHAENTYIVLLYSIVPTNVNPTKHLVVQHLVVHCLTEACIWITLSCKTISVDYDTFQTIP